MTPTARSGHQLPRRRDSSEVDTAGCARLAQYVRTPPSTKWKTTWRRPYNAYWSGPLTPFRNHRREERPSVVISLTRRILAPGSGSAARGNSLQERGSLRSPAARRESRHTEREGHARAGPGDVTCSGLLDSRPEWYIATVTFTIEIEREDDGRWLAEVPALSGVMTYGKDRDEAVARVQALALRVIAERLEHREAPAEFLNVTFQAA